MSNNSNVEPAMQRPKGRVSKVTDPAVDYLAVSVTRYLSGAIVARKITLDPATKRVHPATVLEGSEKRTTRGAMLEWAQGAVNELELDALEQGGLF